MEIGAVFPQSEIGSDPAVIKDFAQAAEALGYSHCWSTTTCSAPSRTASPA